MKILQVHNYYTQAGGENEVLDKEKYLLEKNGAIVERYTKKSSSIDSVQKKIQTLISIAYSKKIFNEFVSYCKEFKPDLVHVHNTYPLITPSVFFAAKYLNIPVVYTLHNYRLIYPNALLMHNGRIDERTITKSSYKTVFQKVYRNSYLHTFALAYLIEYHRKRKTWHSKVDMFIALTDFAKEKFSAAGLPASKISVKPNFVNDPYREFDSLNSSSEKSGYLFVGRLSEEKGIEILIDAWIKYELKHTLFVIGDGPLKEKLKNRSVANSNIKWLGIKDKREVYRYMTEVKALVFPSIWYEGFPMTIVESLAIGTPVITSNIGSQKSIINDQITGLHFNSGDPSDLMKKINILESNDDLMYSLGMNARQEYLNNYTPEINFDQLMSIYDKICSNRRGK